MILFISNYGESLPIVHRLIKEGTDAKIYIHSSVHSSCNYSGICDSVPIESLKQVAKDAELIIFDSVIKYSKSKKDFIVKSITKLKKKIIGVSEPIDNLTIEDAKAIGIKIPKTYKFKTLNECNEFLKKKTNKLWVLESKQHRPYTERHEGELLSRINSGYWGRNDESFIIQEKIRGISINTEMWFDGNEISFFSHTIESRNLFTGAIGIETGSQSNCTWIKQEDGLLKKELEKLVPALQVANYIGAIGVNCVISAIDKKVYFVRWLHGFKYDSMFNILSLIDKRKSSLTDFFMNGFKMQLNGNKYCCSERITLPPYPYSDRNLLLYLATGIPIDDSVLDDKEFWGQDIKKKNSMLMSAGSDGILGIVSGCGRTIRSGFSSVYRYTKNIKVAGTLQYRIDGIKETEKKIRKLKEWSINVT
jgi:phosphoribosylamine-glycine ligase